MIQKLDILKNVVNCVDRNGITRAVSGPDCICAINDLIDTVNALVKENNIHEEQIDELQMKVEPEKCETPADPFAEQRKWIGKLCRFWDDDDAYDVCGYYKLKSIDPDGENPYIPDGFLYHVGHKHCEPVKPDDSIIYQGE